MNRDRILLLATAIETNSIEHVDTNGVRFDMQEVSDVGICGTQACMVGYALALKNGEFKAVSSITDIEAAGIEAGEWLGLDYATHDRLFFPDNYPGETGMGCRGDLRSVTEERAVTVLRNLANTGEVNWSDL